MRFKPLRALFMLIIRRRMFCFAFKRMSVGSLLSSDCLPSWTEFVTRSAQALKPAPGAPTHPLYALLILHHETIHLFTLIGWQMTILPHGKPNRSEVKKGFLEAQFKHTPLAAKSLKCFRICRHFESVNLLYSLLVAVPFA